MMEEEKNTLVSGTTVSRMKDIPVTILVETLWLARDNEKNHNNCTD